MMTNGLGAIIGGYASGASGDASRYADGMLQVSRRSDIWFIFAGYALVIGILFCSGIQIHKHQPEELSKK